MMPKQYKVNACLTFLLAVVFYLFWQVCKQQPALAQVATFTEDPYDAVGSFGTQLALFAALLSMIRAFRPYQPDQMGERQQELFARGAFVTCLSVAVTLGADVVAMLRFSAVWLGLSAGYALLALVIGMALLTALVGWRIHSVARGSVGFSIRGRWIRAIGISLVGAVFCSLYPQNWRQYVLTGGFGTIFILFTALMGMFILFAAVWAWSMVISPSMETFREDFIDDLAALYGRLKVHTGRLSVLLLPFERILSSSLLRPIVNILNPRKNRWYGIALVGLCIGAAFAFGETGLHTGISRIEIFAGIECLGLLVGYAMFVRLLWLARNDGA